MNDQNIRWIRAPFVIESQFASAVILVTFILLGIHPALTQIAIRPATATATTETLALSGNDWKLGSFKMDEGEKHEAFLPSFDDRLFRTVTVPGEVQLQIGLKGMDLYYQSKALSLINEKEWWYRKQFNVPKQNNGKLNRLIFGGVDYFATVWLNGKKLGEHEGTYVPFSYDVTDVLHYGGDNVLVVKVTCPWIPKGRSFLEYMKGNWTAVNPGDQLHIDKPPYFLGAFWDGTPNDGNATLPMGLWRDVKLVSSGFSVVDDVFVSTKSLNSDGSATLAISGTIRNYRDRNVTTELRLKISPKNFTGESISLPVQSLILHPGTNNFSLTSNIKSPHLWWSWDLGKPNLYKLTAGISPQDSDSHSVIFGIRTITVKSDMSYWLNGRRLFLKGAWYPMSDYYGSKTSHETYVKDLELVKAANLNHLVAFTVVEKPDFYDLCDQLGILLIFELPFEQSGPVDVLSSTNPRRSAYIKESLSQVQQVIVELRSHPSIIEWAAFAEAHEKSGGWGIGNWNFDSYGYGEFAATIGNLVGKLDPGTIYHPSLCDLGEQHFWEGAAGIGVDGSYRSHFNAQAGLISEYGSLSLPVLESFQKEISTNDMWSEQHNSLPSWNKLPINISAYSYLTSYTYDGLASTLDRVDEYVDRHIESAQDLVNDSELYQAFLFKYATEAYRRKKYSPVNGTRIWDFGEVWPGIRWGVVDYYRVPKMAYYSLKNAQARFLLSFAYEDELESQVSGTQLQIPVWIVNDHLNAEAMTVHCTIQDLSGHVVWQRDFLGVAPADGRKQIGIVQWVTPDTTGVYVLTGTALGKQAKLQASNSSFIKVTPRLFQRSLNVLLIGQKKYSAPIAQMVHALGMNVEVMDEDSLEQFSNLSDGKALRKKYDVIWLAAFDSIWRLLNQSEVDGLKEAVHSGTGFIHTGGRGSFHGGFGEGATLDVTGLDDLLPVKLHNRYDLVLGQPDERAAVSAQFSPIRDIQLARDAGTEWNDGGLKDIGLPGFNDTDLKPGAQEILTVHGHPLFATWRYGQGRTVAFTGFTPAKNEDEKNDVLDQELYAQPIDKAYFRIFMQLLVAATGEKPQNSYHAILSQREEPLFEMLKNIPQAGVRMPEIVKGQLSQGRGRFSIQLTNKDRYARLIRIRAKWDHELPDSPYLVLYDDNYFDLLPGETKTVDAELFLPEGNTAAISGALTVEGVNLPASTIEVKLDSTAATRNH